MRRESAEISGFIDMHISNVSIAIGSIVPMNKNVCNILGERGAFMQTICKGATVGMQRR